MRDLFFWFNHFSFKGFKFVERDFRIYLSVLILAVFLLTLLSSGLSEEKVQYLKKVGEIKEGFSSERENFFIKITGLCCDDEGNLYVADSGWNKIFKFDPNGKFIKSFGREGQGPGEFIAQRNINPLAISFGNDRKVYVNDPGNRRISVFSKDGKFITQYKVPPLTYDAPLVNSKGDLYLLSQSGIKVIDRYDSNLRLKASLLEIGLHYQFPYGRPKELNMSQPIIRKPMPFECYKLITRKDEIIILSNNSLKVFIFDENNRKVNEFPITEKKFVEDFKNIMNNLRGKKGAWVFPFIAFLDKDENICLFYAGWDGNINEIYVYGTNGKLQKMLKLSKNSEAEYITSNNLGKFYFASFIEIKIYKY